MSLHSRFVVAITAAFASSAIACAPNSGNSDGNGPSGTGAESGAGGGGGSGTSGAGAKLGVGGDPGGPVFSGDAAVTTRGDGSALTADAGCGTTVLKPEAITVEKTVQVDINCTQDVPEPIAIYIVLDNSGSMKDNNKWNDAVTALTTFVHSDTTLVGKGWTCKDKDGKDVTPPSDLPPAGTGEISIAIQYFHPENVGNNPNECDGSGHRTAAVPIGPLPANAQSIINSLGSTGPNGDTPTVGALRGGTDFCTLFQAPTPDKNCAVVLVTDGQPNGCGLSSNCSGGGGNDCVDPASASTLTPIASAAFGNPNNSVRTFTVGMSGVNAAGFDLLNAIAVAGGSDCTPNTPGNEACNITTSGAQGFLDALNTIRKTVQVSSTRSQNVTTMSTVTSTLPCEWAIPKPDKGATFDKNRVNVKYSVSGAAHKLGNVATQPDCASASGGWYYDDPSAPTRILACPDTCTVLQSTPDVSVSVVIGCKTEKAGVR